MDIFAWLVLGILLGVIPAYRIGLTHGRQYRNSEYERVVASYRNRWMKQFHEEEGNKE